ncbi:MAG: membrane integrity-associated transporter subunit PqiC [Alphaproteobacteria bacterium]|jgi:cholesterol transport system auxiliary component|nr:membrane integrity-associated transporter subunit PqiC [Alphaproteobacteria bacterium]
MRSLFLASAALALGGCSLGLTAKAPAFLMTLTPDQRPPASEGGAVESAAVLTVMTPLAPQAIATTRLPVAQGQTALAYVKDAVWVEPPARLFQRLLAETIRARSGRVVLDPRQFNMDPGATLSGQLLRFDVDERGATAIVVYDATLSGEADPPVRTRRFEARVAMGRIDAQSASQALNRAANQVAADVADWVKR